MKKKKRTPEKSVSGASSPKIVANNYQDLAKGPEGGEGGGGGLLGGEHLNWWPPVISPATRTKIQQVQMASLHGPNCIKQRRQCATMGMAHSLEERTVCLNHLLTPKAPKSGQLVGETSNHDSDSDRQSSNPHAARALNGPEASFRVRLVEQRHTDFICVGPHFAQAKYVLAAGRVRVTGLFWGLRPWEGD